MNQGPGVDFPQLVWRPAAASDVPAWAALIARTAAVENPVWYDREADLEQQVESGKNPLAANTVLGLDGGASSGPMPGLRRTRTADKAHGFGCVDPGWQRRGVGTALLGWLEQRARATLRRGRRGSRSSGAGHACGSTPSSSTAPGRPARVTGYAVVRYYNEMHRPLDQPAARIALGRGLELVALGPELHEPVRLAHNAAFRDHWGSEPRDEEAWGFVVNDPQARPDLSAVVLDRPPARWPDTSWPATIRTSP